MQKLILDEFHFHNFEIRTLGASLAGAGKVAEKAAEATKSVGNAVKKTGESIQKKRGT